MSGKKKVLKGLCHYCLSSNMEITLDPETGLPVCGKCVEKKDRNKGGSPYTRAGAGD